MPATQTAPGAVERVASASGSSFFYAFLTLPRARRRALFDVYAFCHAVDDAVDDAPDPATARAQIEGWRARVAAALDGRPGDPVARRLGEVAEAYRVPGEALYAVIDGVASDLDRGRRFASWDELAAYCDLVAGAVGRISIRIFGRDDDAADRYAVTLGRALQLTNILRDLGPDARLGRFYLPQDELRRFAVDEDVVLDERDDRRLPLLEHEASRAQTLFKSAAAFGRRGGSELTAAEVMRAIYRRLLSRVRRAQFPVGPPVAAVPRREKAAIALATWVRVGLLRRARRTGP